MGCASSKAFCALYIACAVAVGNVLLAVLSSLPTVGSGLWVLSLLAEDEVKKRTSMAGAAFLMVGLFLLAVFYVFNFHQWKSQLGKMAATAFAWVMFFTAAIFQGYAYPWAPTVCVWLLMTFMLLAIRRRSASWELKVEQAEFALMMGLTFLIWAGIMITVWSLLVALDDNSLQELREREYAQKVYEFFNVQLESINGANHCVTKQGDHNMQKEAVPTTTVHMDEKQVRINTLCAQANNVILITWAQPLIAGLVNLASSIFFIISAYYLIRKDPPQAGQLKVQGMTLVVVLTALIGGLYVATYFSEISVNVTVPLLLVLFVGGVAGCAWLFVELKAHEDKEYGSFVNDVKQSPWIQAMAVGSGFIPTFMVLEMARQSCAKKADDEEDGPGDAGGSGCCGGELGSKEQESHDWSQGKVDLLKAIKEEWRWSEILIKICLLGEVFFTLEVLGTKVTYVFLAWLNSQIGDAGLWPVIGIAFSVGFLMFMLPPVPGVPVYIFCGIVVSLQGTDDIGFNGVCLLAISLSLALKLSACTGQYYIGYYLGQNPRVLHFIGIDTPVTQAIKNILDGPNLCDWSRVFVLVGGPDWPTSVTCGILQVDLGRMLLGTLPCLLTASPCVLAGVFLADAKDGKEAVPWHKAAGSAATVIAGMVQMGSMLLATTTIWRKVHEEEAHPERDTKEIPIPKEVTALREREEAYNNAFSEIQARRGWMFWCVLMPAAFLILMTGYAFAGFQSLLFENFSVSGNIDDEIDDFGLGGKPLDIVKWPMGWAAICFFLAGVLLHTLYFVLVGREAEKLSRSTQVPNGTSDEATRMLLPNGSHGMRDANNGLLATTAAPREEHGLCCCAR